MTTVPPTVLTALGRLNAHAHACRGSWNPSRAIYRYKTLAALLLVVSGEATLRFVHCDVACGCDNGWYWYDWPDDKRRCRYCSGNGVRRLRFTETTLADAQIWHHPWEGQTTPGRDIARAVVDPWPDLTDGLPWQDVGDWRPRQPAEPLPLDELATLLNCVEDWIDAEPPSSAMWGAPHCWRWRDAKECLHQHKHRNVIGPHSHVYQLDLGRAPGGCFVCGTIDDLAGLTYGRISPLFKWSLPVCKRHGEGRHKAPHPDGPPPDALITAPLRQWLARHEHVVEVA